MNKEFINKIGADKIVKNCEFVADCLELVGNTAIESIENGRIEIHPMLQIRKAIDEIEQEHIRKTGKAFRRYAEEALAKMGLKPLDPEPEGDVH